MKKHGTANVLLVELLVVIFFFLLCVATIVEIFGMARVKSAEAKSITQAMLRVENLEACLADNFETENALAQNGFQQEEDGWTLRQEDYTLRAMPVLKRTEAGVLRTVTFIAEGKTGNPLFKLPLTHYWAEGVSP